MKVGVYLPAYEPSAGGGYTFAYDVVENLLALMPSSPHEFTFFSPQASKELDQRLEKAAQTGVVHTRNASPLPIRILRKISNGLANQRRYPGDLSYAAERAGMDVLWFVSPTYEPVNLPYIATIWDLQHRLQPWFPEVGSIRDWFFREGYYSAFVQRASYLIAGTQAGADEIALFYQIPKDRIKILPHPTPGYLDGAIQTDGNETLAKYNLSAGGYLFYPAQFWAHKNHANLLSALKILRQDLRVPLDLVLTGSEQGNMEYIRRLADELEIKPNVHILDFVSRKELIALYQNAFALTYVSFFGPENLPPLEAFSIGCPVIASAVSGSDEQLGGAAILVDPKKPEEIAQAVLSLFETPSLRTTLIAQGRARVAERTGKRFVEGVFLMLDEFHAVRRAWK